MIPNQQNQKERKPEIASKTKKFHVIIPLIVMLMLICVIAITLVVGAPFGSPSETAELNKDVEQEEEHISAAVDIAATSIGTNTKATFTASTGEIHIYNSSTSGAEAYMSKSSWYTFLKKIITADGNLDAVKSIKFSGVIYAPEDSSRLFYPLISSKNYPLTQLTTINNFGSLRLHSTTNVSYMFAECNNLTTDLDLWKSYSSSSVITSWDGIFKGCSSIRNIDLSKLYLGANSDFTEAFTGCSSLESLKFPGSGAREVRDLEWYVCWLYFS